MADELIVGQNVSCLRLTNCRRLFSSWGCGAVHSALEKPHETHSIAVSLYKQSKGGNQLPIQSSNPHAYLMGREREIDETSPTHDCFSSLSTHESQNNTKSNHEWNTTTANPMCGTKSGTSILAHPRLGPSIVITDHTSLCFLCPPTRCVNRERQPSPCSASHWTPNRFFWRHWTFLWGTNNERGHWVIETVDPSQQSRSGLCCWVVLHSLLPT